LSGRDAYIFGVLHVAGRDGRRIRRVTPPGMLVGAFAWSPDGRQLAVMTVTRKEELVALRVLSARGGHNRLVRRFKPGSSGYADRPTLFWGRDGRRLYFLTEARFAARGRAK
jgi:Tol biopolymer transport system component